MIVIMYLLIAKGEATIALVNRHTDLINFICMTNCLVEHSASICFVLLEHGLKRWERIMRGESSPLSLVPLLKMTDKISTNKVWYIFVDKLMLLKQWSAFYKIQAALTAVHFLFDYKILSQYTGILRRK